MPGVPRMLAVNRVKARYSPETVANEAQRLQDRFGLSEVYVAYDYRSALAGDRIPIYPSNLQVDGDDEQHPIFFRADAQSGVSKQVVYLHDLSTRLDVGALARESSRSLRLQLKTTATAAIKHLETNNQSNQRCIEKAWQAVADACFDFMAERNADVPDPIGLGSAAYTGTCELLVDALPGVLALIEQTAAANGRSPILADGACE